MNGKVNKLDINLILANFIGQFELVIASTRLYFIAS